MQMISPLVPISIVSLGLESVLYGIFLTLFFLYLALRPRGVCPRAILYSSLFILFVVSLHWVLSVAQFFQAFVFYRDGSAPAEFLSNVSQILAVIKVGTYMMLFVIGDLAMIYRLWAVWNRDKMVIILPITMFVGQCVFAVVLVSESFTPHANLIRNPGVYASMLTLGTIGLSMTTFCINVYSTALIACRIWRMEQSSGTINSKFGFVIMLLIESLALNSAWGVVYIICYGARTWAAVVVSDTQAPITGIAFMLINVRVGVRQVKRGCVEK
ncbi:hypothetical protein BD779DRAFT_785150 [Infundibulicybe gibba]|nr:hypothetical protein BD779DRAFT_785150 [Infundibulicybe gibba]